MRRFFCSYEEEYIDKVYIVTSSEYMSVYAANNILQAVKGFSDKEKNLLGGLIWNHCQSEWDKEVGESFADLTKANILMFLSEWEELQKNDYAKTLITQKSQNKMLKEQFEKLVDQILGNEKITHTFLPCDIEELETWRESVVRLL